MIEEPPVSFLDYLAKTVAFRSKKAISSGALLSHSDATQLLGYAAGVITTISFIPQLIRLVKTKSGKDISFAMMLLFSTGVLAWLIYGVLTLSLPIIIANSLTLLISLGIMGLKLYYEK